MIGVTRGVVSLGIIDILPFWLPRKHVALIHGTLWHYNNGPVPFGVEPFASDLAMLPLLFHNVSVVRSQFPQRLLKYRLTLTHPGHRAYQENPSS